MFSRDSRYADLENLIYRSPDGRERAYRARRFVPRSASLPASGEVVVQQGSRLDLIAAARLGSPELFWRLADANDALNPFELTATPGRVLRVPALRS
jgi:hypothetical protein